MAEKEPRNSDVFIDRGEPLPRAYGESRIVALMRDPTRVFVYWELAEDPGRPVALRVRCLSDGTSQELLVSEGAENWYIPVRPNRRYAVELGVRDADGRFEALARSAEVSVPVESLAQVVEEPDHAGESPLSQVLPHVTGSRARAQAEKATIGPRQGEEDAGAGLESAPPSTLERSPVWWPTAELADLFRPRRPISSPGHWRGGSRGGVGVP